MLEDGVLVVVGALRNVHLPPDLGHQLVQRTVGQCVADRLGRVIGEEELVEAVPVERRHAAPEKQSGCRSSPQPDKGSSEIAPASFSFVLGFRPHCLTTTCDTWPMAPNPSPRRMDPETRPT